MSQPPARGRPAPHRASRKLSLWLPVLIYMAAIFTASSMSEPPMPQQVSDVSLHSLAYFGLTLLLIRALARNHWNGVTLSTLAIAWAMATAYGVSDEWHQSFVPNRQADLRDVIANAIGAMAAAIIVGAWGIIRRL